MRPAAATAQRPRRAEDAERLEALPSSSAPAPTSALLAHLDDDERALDDDLVADRPSERVRLEQQRIDWTWVMQNLPYR